MTKIEQRISDLKYRITAINLQLQELDPETDRHLELEQIRDDLLDRLCCAEVDAVREEA